MFFPLNPQFQNHIPLCKQIYSLMQKAPNINWIYADLENTMMKVKSPYQQEKKNYS